MNIMVKDTIRELQRLNNNTRKLPKSVQAKLWVICTEGNLIYPFELHLEILEYLWQHTTANVEQQKLMLFQYAGKLQDETNIYRFLSIDPDLAALLDFLA